MSESSHPSEWHSIRPYRPPIQLSVREVTSVSCSFLLSSPLSSSAWPSSDSDEETIVVDDLESNAPCFSHSDDDDDDGIATTSKRPVSSALSRGVNVSVNGVSWDRALVRVGEKTDEAVVIVYDLMPRRQYDIELTFVAASAPLTETGEVISEGAEEYGTSVLRESVVTQDTEAENPPSDASPIVVTPSDSSVDSHPAPSIASGPVSSQQGEIGYTPPPITVEDHLAHLRHVLASTSAERDQLTATIKSTRKDSQKGDAALRSEIDRLKAQSDKYMQSEQRARQKTLALQETVKRTQQATAQLEEDLNDVDALLPDMVSTRDAKENEISQVRDASLKAKKEREKLDKEHTKAIDTLTAELSSLQHKHERLIAKREKLENVTLQDLEEQLREVEVMIDLAEKEAGSMEISQWPTASSDPSPFSGFPQRQPQSVQGSEDILPSSHSFPGAVTPTSQFPVSPHPGSIGAPTKLNRFSLPPPISPPAPIQRPYPGVNSGLPPSTAGARAGSLPSTLSSSSNASGPEYDYDLPSKSRLSHPSLSQRPLAPSSSQSSTKTSSSMLSSAAAPFQPSGKSSLLFGSSAPLSSSPISPRLPADKKAGSGPKQPLITILKNPRREGTSQRNDSI